MNASQPTGEEVVGLTLFLTGNFDPRVFVDGLALKPLRYEQSSDNSVTVLHQKKVRFVPTRKVELDRVKFSVPGDKSIPNLFQTLVAAVARLPPEARTTWNALTERTADLGVNWTNCSNCGTEYDIPERIVKALAEAGIALRISVYATSDAIDKALRDRTEADRIIPKRETGYEPESET